MSLQWFALAGNALDYARSGVEGLGELVKAVKELAAAEFMKCSGLSTAAQSQFRCSSQVHEKLKMLDARVRGPLDRAIPKGTFMRMAPCTSR